MKREMVVSAMSIAATDRDVSEMLINALVHDSDPTVRTMAASSMAEGNCRTCIPALRRNLDDKDIVVAFAAAKALWEMGDRSGLPLFEEVLSGQRKTRKELFEELSSKRTAPCTIHRLWLC